MNALAQASPPQPTTPGVSLQSFLCFDVGTKRTGVAYAERILRQPVAQATIAAQGDARFIEIAKRITQWQPDALVLGVPLHPDGAPHEMTAQARRFARQLRGRFGLPVFEVDERYSTTEANARGVSDADAGAACVILEQFLRTLP